ncbi:MAG: glycosyltransferase family 2 protein [Acetobacteraceae bacterium]
MGIETQTQFDPPPGVAPVEPGAARNDDRLRPTVAVIVPCYNEEATVHRVVLGFRAALPDATVFVYNNNSSDRTVAVAQEAGAVVRHEPLRGKGRVIRRAFADVEADIYVLVDGDDTYDAAAAGTLVRLLVDEHLDMVIGARQAESKAAYRVGHRFGNVMLTGIVRWIFGDRVSDMLSGYRVFSRRFVKSFPALAAGFETETEFTIHALELGMPIAEVSTIYRERGAGSSSKLHTFRDGFRIVRTILILIKEERPLPFFSICAAFLLLFGLALGIPVTLEFFATGLVPRLPTAVLAMGFVLLSFLSLTCGLVLDSVARGRKEVKRLAYLALKGI